MSDPLVPPDILELALELAEKYPLPAIDEARRITVRSIPCPYCFVPAGSKCISGSMKGWSKYKPDEERTYLMAQDGPEYRRAFYKRGKEAGKLSYLARSHKERVAELLKQQGFQREQNMRVARIPE